MNKIRTGKQGFENLQSTWGQANLVKMFCMADVDTYLLAAIT